MAGLTLKQERFVEEFLLDLNAKQAAIRAGYAHSSSEVQGSRLLSNANVSVEIDRRRCERAEKLNVDAAWVLKRLADEAKADIADLYDKNTGALLPVHEWPLIWRQGLVQSIEIEELFGGKGDDREHIGRVRKIKLDNRVRRLELIGKHVRVNAFQDKVQVQIFDGLAERLARAYKRTA